MTSDNIRKMIPISPKGRGHLTKGNVYKDRYVEVECPECGYNKAYRDEGNTIISFKCLKRNCRYNWIEHKKPIKKQEKV